MQRREFITAVATAAVATATAPQAGARALAAPTGIERPVIFEKYAGLEAAALSCIDAGETCLRRCFEALATQDRSMAACAEAAYALVAAGRAVRTLAAARSVHVPIFAKALEETCITCRAECDKFPGVTECAACAEACATCAEACRWTA
jgi:Cys-rich four helix bundle protein (predicted Tat secretion target)